MLADLHRGRPGGNRSELAADGDGALGLGVETVDLRQSAGEEDVDAGPRRLALPARGPQGSQLADTQPEQADGAGLKGCPPRDEGVLEVIASEHADPSP